MLPLLVFALRVEAAVHSKLWKKTSGDGAARGCIADERKEINVIEGRRGLTDAVDGRSSCAFLIDTLPIRIASNSFDCFIGTRSNRHSSGPLNLHQNCAGRATFSSRQAHILDQTSESGSLGCHCAAASAAPQAPTRTQPAGLTCCGGGRYNCGFGKEQSARRVRPTGCTGGHFERKLRSAKVKVPRSGDTPNKDFRSRT